MLIGTLLLVVGTAAAGEKAGRVLLIGIDGANLRAARPLLEAGRLPNLERLAREGVSGELQSFLPLQSPRIWTTIATGVTPERHGVLSFFYVENEQRRLYRSSDRKVPALWNIASARGLSVGVVNWWTTHPPEIVNGILISDHLLAGHVNRLRRLMKLGDESKGALAYPREWQARALAASQSEQALCEIEDPFADVDSLPRWVVWTRKRAGVPYLTSIYQEDAAITRIALALQAELHPDLMMVLLPGIDRVSHVLWSTLEPPELYPPGLRPYPEARVAGRAALERYYEYSDALIGLLMADYVAADTVVVVSDHGFEAGRGGLGISGIHESEKASKGVVFARGPGIAPGSPAGGVSVNDVAPTVLVALGLPAAEDMDGRPAAFLERGPKELVASYGEVPVERLGSEASGIDEKLIENLRAIGYAE